VVKSGKKIMQNLKSASRVLLVRRASGMPLLSWETQSSCFVQTLKAISHRIKNNAESCFEKNFCLII
jgi:hypothetical protein